MALSSLPGARPRGYTVRGTSPHAQPNLTLMTPASRSNDPRDGRTPITRTDPLDHKATRQELAPLVIYPSRWRLAGMFILGLSLFAFGALVLEPWVPAKLILVLSGWVTLLFGLAACWAAGAQLVHRRPLLALNAAGVVYVAGFVRSPTFVAWSDITSARILDMRGSKLLALSLANPEESLASLPRISRWSAKLDASIGLKYSAQIPLVTAPLPADTVLAHVNQYRQRYGTRPHAQTARTHVDVVTRSVNDALDGCRTRAEIEQTLAGLPEVFSMFLDQADEHGLQSGLDQACAQGLQSEVLPQIHWRESFEGVVSEAEFEEIKRRLLAH